MQARSALFYITMTVVIAAAAPFFAATTEAQQGRKSAKAPSTKAQSTTFTRYVNVRFKYGIDYPSKILKAQGEAPNSDGQKFVSVDGKSELLVWGEHAINAETGDPLSIEEDYRAAVKRRGNSITKKKVGKSWYTLSGFAGGKVFHTKTLESDGDFKRIEFTYPKDQSKTFDVLVAPIMRSFRNTL